MLYERNVGYLGGVCARYLPDNEDVKDLLQDAFIKIFDNMGKFRYRGEGSLRAWMARIVVNDSLKALKPHRRVFPLLQDADPGMFAGVFSEPVSEGPDPPMDGIPLEVLLEMIRSLPPGYRTVFNLFVFEEKSHKEIARMLGIRENSSASQLHHAKAMLCERIKEYRLRHGDG